MKRAVSVLAALAITGSAAASAQACNRSGRIDAQCYPDLQAATAANQPLWLPAGTYTLTQTLIDHAPVAATGFQIISDAAILDGGRFRGQKRCGSNAAARPPTTPRAASTSKSKAHDTPTPKFRPPPSGSTSTFLGRTIRRGSTA